MIRVGNKHDMNKQTIKTKALSKMQAQQLLHQMAEHLDENQHLQQMIAQLRRYETQYALSTVEFYPQFIAGTLDDSSDFMIWASVYETYVELTQPHLVAHVVA